MSFGYQVLGFGTVAGAPEVLYAATGGTVTTDGDYKVHSFTSSGTFAVTQVASDPSSAELDYLIIAGGGGGGNNSGCGGGAGGRLYLENYTGITSTGDITVTVGAGGAAKTGSNYGRGNNGADSVFNSITATGGGGGGGWTSASSHQAGADGGSGGGSGNNATPGQGIDGQGNDGGTASGYSMGAGGGAGSAASGTSRGEGVADSITGSSVTRARGSEQGDGTGGANTGNGGFRSTAGGSGIVIIRYKFQ